tara:strand:- start:333 stop:1490 length:1158 start_codon:yes stop_codon:yes gene_type:complete
MILAVGKRATRIALVCVFPLVANLAEITTPSAQTRDSFTVAGIAVDSTAETATEARGLALASGQREALDRLIKRLTLREYYPQIPHLSDAAVASLVQGIEVRDEKTSSRRYLANLVVSFKKNEVRALLRGSGVPFSETPSRPLLILPVYEAAGARNLWDDPNPWWAAWQALAEHATVVPFIIPVGDLTDVATIGADQALAGDEKPLAVLARRYEVEDILVVHAILRQDLAAGIPRLAVTMHRHGPKNSSVVVESFTGVSRTMVDVLLERASDEIATKIEENWKRITLLRFEDEGLLSAGVPLSGLGDWVEVRWRLSQAAEIGRVEILEINREAVQVALYYFGSSDQLAVTLAQRNLDLAEEDGYWIVRLRKKRGVTAGGNRMGKE